MCQPCSDPVSPLQPFQLCCMLRPRVAQPVTPDFDAPEQGKEMEWADMQLPICGQCPADEKRARAQGHARGLPSPNEPTAEESAIHKLTHTHTGAGVHSVSPARGQTRPTGG